MKRQTTKTHDTRPKAVAVLDADALLTQEPLDLQPQDDWGWLDGAVRLMQAAVAEAGAL